MTSEAGGERFEARYRENPDPWSFASSEYELHRYGILLQGLASPCYSSAFEIGCSVGVFTAMLAPRCTRLLAIDVAPSAIALARKRCLELPQVQFQVADVRTVRQRNAFDLILLNEVGYYFDLQTLAVMAVELSEMLCARGELVASHWLGHSADHVSHGDDVHHVLERNVPLAHVRSTRYGQFRVDAWTQTSSAQ